MEDEECRKVIDVVFKQNLNNVIDLQQLFLGETLPPLDHVRPREVVPQLPTGHLKILTPEKTLAAPVTSP